MSSLPIALYVMATVCSVDCNPPTMGKGGGGLVFTSLEECETAGKELDSFYKGTKLIGRQGEDLGKVRGWHHVCGTAYFNDYGQTERLIYGHVTCLYSTTIPEGVMSRAASLQPYLPSQGCKK